MAVEWSYDFEPCKDLEECLSKARHSSKDVLVSCARDEIDFDARGSGEGPYSCEITFYAEEPAVVYERPEPVNWEELVALMDRFAKGEDFSFTHDEWELSREIDPVSMDELREMLNQATRRMRIKMALWVLAVVLVIVLLFLIRFYL